MRVSKEFINLLNLPLSQLEAIAEELDVAIPRDARKWDVVRLLAQKPSNSLAPYTNEWAYAGKTSVTYVRLGNGEPLGENLIVAALTDMCDGSNPLTEDIRPESLSSRPALIAAEKIDGKFFLTFGVKRPTSQHLRDFELETVESDEFFSAVVRPEKAILEVRTNGQRAHRLGTTWIAEFSDFLFPSENEEMAT